MLGTASLCVSPWALSLWCLAMSSANGPALERIGVPGTARRSPTAKPLGGRSLGCGHSSGYLWWSMRSGKGTALKTPASS